MGSHHTIDMNHSVQWVHTAAIIKTRQYIMRKSREAFAIRVMNDNINLDTELREGQVLTTFLSLSPHLPVL